ncbi:MAG: hypothetical protein LBJ93_00390, partial [Clostridiales bacterium]|nr:hypothetical protein [Clostridiales bacterium]
MQLDISNIRNLSTENQVIYFVSLTPEERSKIEIFIQLNSEARSQTFIFLPEDLRTIRVLETLL